MVNWLQDAGIRPCTFDRHRCELCFLGRQAEARIKTGAARSNDQKTYDDYKKHQRIIENQREKVKEDKALNDPGILVAISTTPHFMISPPKRFELFFGSVPMILSSKIFIH